MAMTGFQAGQLALGGINSAYGMFNDWQQQKWQKGNSAAATKRNMLMWQAAMDWQERMDNTKHQREVKDLEAAELNPILSATQGATGAGPAPAGNVSQGGSLSINSAGATELQSALNDIQANARQNELNSAQTAKTKAETLAILENVPYIGEKNKAEIEKIIGDILYNTEKTTGQKIINKIGNTGIKTAEDLGRLSEKVVDNITTVALKKKRNYKDRLTSSWEARKKSLGM